MLSPPASSSHPLPALQELFDVLASGWQSLDCINLAAALHHLAALAEAAPGGGAAFCRRQLLGDPRWGWLLDELLKAAATPGFGPQCVSNSLAALCKLDALSPPLLLALRAPLLRALRSPAPAQRLSTRGLTQLLWCIGKDVKSLEPLVLAVKGPLLEAVWAAAPELDAQVGAACGRGGPVGWVLDVFSVQPCGWWQWWRLLTDVWHW